MKDIGDRYHLLESGFKPHAACRYAHGPIDAAVGLRRTHEFEVEEIESIDVYLSALANRQSNFYEPQSISSAQGSTPFAIAASLVCSTDSLSISDMKKAFGKREAQSIRDLTNKIETLPTMSQLMNHVSVSARVA